MTLEVFVLWTGTLLSSVLWYAIIDEKGSEIGR